MNDDLREFGLVAHSMTLAIGPVEQVGEALVRPTTTRVFVVSLTADGKPDMHEVQRRVEEWTRERG